MSGRRSLEVRSAGVVLHVTVEEADDPAAPTVVFVHGYPDSSAVWDQMRSLLAGRYRTVAYDTRGTCGSTAPPSAKGYRIDALQADLLAVLDAVADGPDTPPVHLVAHDWGSIQCWSFLLSGALTDRIASFTSISGPPLELVRPWILRGLRSSRRARAVGRQLLRSWYTVYFQLPLLPELAWRTGGKRLATAVYAASGVPTPASHVSPTVSTDARRGLALYRQNLLAGMKGGQRPVSVPDVPVQVVVPTHDKFVTPALTEDLGDAVPTLYRRQVAAGHWAPLSHPEVLVRFVDEMVSGCPATTRSPSWPSPPARSLRAARVTPGGPAFADKVVVVTGAGRGIGRATALAFAARGAVVAVADRDPIGLEGTVAQALRAGASAARAYPTDVTDREAMAAFAEAVRNDLGVPDVVVNNAGVGAAGPFLATEPEEWDRVMAVNLDGVATGCRLFGRQMVERGEGGHIVNISSAVAYLISRATPVYGTSKAATLALSEYLRAELSPHSIGVSAICPGIIDTGIVRTTRVAGVDDDEQAATRARLDRLYRLRGFPPEKVADAIVEAVIRNRAVVPVSAEAHLSWIGAHLAPRLMRRVARLDPTDPFGART